MKRGSSRVTCTEQPEQLPGPREPASCKVGHQGGHTDERAKDCAMRLDVLEGHVDIAVWPSGEQWQERNDPGGCAALVEAGQRGWGQTVIVLEATGGYEKPRAAAALAAARLARRGGQTQTGQRFRPGQWQAGQDGRALGGHSGPLRRRDAAAGAAVAGCPDPRAATVAGAAPPARGDDDRRTESAGGRPAAGAEADPGPRGRAAPPAEEAWSGGSRT